MATAGEFPAKDLIEKDPADWQQLAASKCLRCSGHMVIEQYVDFRLWRCVQCGEIIDPVILQNRQHNNREHSDSKQVIV